MMTESTVDTAVATSAISRTASGRWRAVNMISTAPTNGAHVMTDRTGNGIMAVRAAARPARAVAISSQPPLGEHEEQQRAQGHAVEIVLRHPALQAAQPVTRPQRPRAQRVEHAVHEIAVDPADQPGERQ